MSGRTVAALCVRRDSIYHRMRGVSAYDADRGARSFGGGMPVVAHPPCRSWGRLRHFSRPAPGERDLARWCVDMVRQWGGSWSTRRTQRCGAIWACRGLVGVMHGEGRHGT